MEVKNRSLSRLISVFSTKHSHPRGGRPKAEPTTRDRNYFVSYCAYQRHQTRDDFVAVFLAVSCKVACLI